MDVVKYRLNVANCVKPGIFPHDLGRKIVKAEEIRHASDYDTFYIVSKAVTAEQIETAERYLNWQKNIYYKCRGQACSDLCTYLTNKSLKQTHHDWHGDNRQQGGKNI